MQPFASLKTSLSDAILTITISRPEALNALNFATLKELDTCFQSAEKDGGIQGIILTGEGEKAFVAGADIREFTGITKESALMLAQNGQKLFSYIENFPKPVIAAVNGFALGGGCELALACHIRIATENARFAQPEVNLGLIPGYGGTQRLTRLVGKGRALELMMTGDMVTAQEAFAMGLVNHVLPNREALLAKAQDLLKKISSRAPVAVAKVIEAVQAAYNGEQAGFEKEAELFAVCAQTADFREGTAAFLEKRKPSFKGK